MGTPTSLLATNVVTVLVVDIDTVKVLVINNGNEGIGKCFGLVFTETVVPAVIRIAWKYIRYMLETDGLKNMSISMNHSHGNTSKDTNNVDMKQNKSNHYLPNQDPPIPAPPNERITFFPSARHESTNA